MMLTGTLLPQELDLKVRQFDILLRQPPLLLEAPNINLLWARLMVEELCRLGASTFCIAPGTPPYIRLPCANPPCPSFCVPRSTLFLLWVVCFSCLAVVLLGSCRRCSGSRDLGCAFLVISAE